MSPPALLAPIQSKHFFLYELVSCRVYPFVSLKDFANQAEHTPTQIWVLQFFQIISFNIGLSFL